VPVVVQKHSFVFQDIILDAAFISAGVNVSFPMCIGHTATPVVVRTSASCGEKVTGVSLTSSTYLGRSFLCQKSLPYAGFANILRLRWLRDDPPNSATRKLSKGDSMSFLGD